MRKILTIALIITIGFVAGCSSVIPYDDDEIVAIVRGEEITIYDLRFMYPDKKLLTMVEGTVKARLVVQEAKRLNLELSEESQALLDANESIGYEANKEFAKRQGIKLGMDPEQYYKQYEEIANEIMVYTSAYVDAMIDPPLNEAGEIDTRKYDREVKKLIDELYEKNKDEIEILITK